MGHDSTWSLVRVLHLYRCLIKSIRSQSLIMTKSRQPSPRWAVGAGPSGLKWHRQLIRNEFTATKRLLTVCHLLSVENKASLLTSHTSFCIHTLSKLMGFTQNQPIQPNVSSNGSHRLLYKQWTEITTFLGSN